MSHPPPETFPRRRFQNDVVLVTGGASGIGRASAIGFAAEGARVAVVDVDDRKGKEVAEAIGQAGGEALFEWTDVSDAQQVRDAVSTVLNQWGKIDVLCNSAAFLFGTYDLLGTSSEIWQKTMDVNLRGVFLCCQAVLPTMLEQKRGAIVNVASVLGLVAQTNYAPYIASKGGLVQLTRSIAVDYGNRGIRANAVCPGSIESPPVAEALQNSPGLREEIVEKIVLRRIGLPEDVANAVLFLASQEAAYITGAILCVDGGWTAV